MALLACAVDLLTPLCSLYGPCAVSKITVSEDGESVVTSDPVAILSNFCSLKGDASGDETTAASVLLDACAGIESGPGSVRNHTFSFVGLMLRVTAVALRREPRRFVWRRD